MNLADIKHEILQLAPSKQREIRAYLEEMQKAEARELARINAAMNAGEWVSLCDMILIAAHEDLVEQGLAEPL